MHVASWKYNSLLDNKKKRKKEETTFPENAV